MGRPSESTTLQLRVSRDVETRIKEGRGRNRVFGLYFAFL
jgi:hypothetical protein